MQKKKRKQAVSGHRDGLRHRDDKTAGDRAVGHVYLAVSVWPQSDSDRQALGGLLPVSGSHRRTHQRCRLACRICA